MNARCLAMMAVGWGMLLASCGDSPSFEYDSQPIFFQSNPLPGATMARAAVGSELSSLLVDTGYPLSALHRGACPAATPEPGTWGLMALALAGLGVFRARRIRKS